MNQLTGTFPYLFLVVLGEAAAATKDFFGEGMMFHPASWTGPTSAIQGSSTRGGGGEGEGVLVALPSTTATI